MEGNKIIFKHILEGAWDSCTEILTMETDARTADAITESFYRFMVGSGYMPESVLESMSICIDTYQNEPAEENQELPDPPF